MIEVKSYPEDLADWDPSKSLFYLEVFGETKPLVDENFAEVLPAGPPSDNAATTTAAPVYEYWWTIGHGGRHGHHHWWGGEPNEDLDAVWDELADDVAARVYFFFPVNRGWRIKELVATVKYLSPVHESKSLLTAVAQDWKTLSPLLADAGQVAGLATGLPGAGAMLSGTSSILDTLAKLQINSVPPSEEFDWSVGKVTFGHDHYGVMQGAMWELPPQMFKQLGGRLTGSLALSFISAHTQGDKPAVDNWPIKPGPLLAHAVVYPKSGSNIWAPGERHFVELDLAPHT